jgi:hypothetical protein
MPMDLNYNIASVYLVRGHHFVVASRRLVRGGNGAEITLAPLEGMRNAAYAIRARVHPGFPSQHLDPAAKGFTELAIKDAIKKVHDTSDKIEQSKQKHADDGTKNIQQLGINIGDFVTIKWSGGNSTQEHCVAINEKTGKIAIRSLRHKGNRRWIPAQQVTVCGPSEKSLPVQLLPHEQSILDEKGWVQIVRGGEFIEHSYVVAKYASDARVHGQDYDAASHVVHLDHTKLVFWRDTGSFD